MAKSSNPVFSSKTFQDQVRAGQAANAMPAPQVDDLESMYAQAPGRPGSTERGMNINDVLNKMLVMAAGILVGGVIGWMLLMNMAQNAQSLGPLVAVAGLASIAALVIGLVNQFKAKASPALSIAYAVLEGFLLGVISALFEIIYPGIVLQAVLGTALVFGVCLFLNRSGKFRTTPKMRKIVYAAGWAFVGFALVNWIISMVSGGAINFRTGWIGLLIGVIGIVIGAFYLITDFEDIETAIRGGAPQDFSWRCAFGLTLSLVWIYVEMIRLISIIRSLAD
ncbi:MAG: Bax inhibitor-1/YccA family protein [Galactobacter sp.]